MKERRLDGLRILVTAGPTREHLDPARFLSNPSSGRMGYALAEVAAARGARVALVSGPTCLDDPAGVEIERVTSAEEMLAACSRLFPTSDILVAAAAVADVRPAERFPTKRSKKKLALRIELEHTPDILATLASDKGRRFVVGFAAQSGDPVAPALAKLKAKNLDLIVANDIGISGLGFGATRNRVIILGADGTALELGPAPKHEIAAGIWDAIATRI